MSFKRVFGTLGSYLIFSILLGILSWGLLSLLGVTGTYQTLSSNSVQVKATVTAVETGPYASVDYFFVVGKKQYEGRAPSKGNNLPTSALAPGAGVNVYYYPPDPRINCPCIPADELSNTVFTALFISILLAMVPTLFVWNWLRNWY